VAHGATLYAGMLLGHPATVGRYQCELLNVNSHSLGVVGVDERIGQHVNKVLIPRNTPIPAHVVKAFKTLIDGQPSVAVPVVEGESECPEFCVPLGRCIVRDLPRDLPKGTPVEVEYRYLANGRLAISAWVPSTGHSAKVEIDRDHTALSGNLDVWKAALLERRPVSGFADATSDGDRRHLGLDVADRASVVKKIDAHHQQIGRLAEKSETPPSLDESRRAVAAASNDLEAATRMVAEGQRHRDGAVGATEIVQLGVELSRSRLAQRQAADNLAFAYLILGRDCIDAGFCPAGAESDLEEIRRLRPYLESTV
jgi:molecular chaperone DnaK